MTAKPMIRTLAPTRVVGNGGTRVVVSHGWMADHTLFDPLVELIDQDIFTYAFIDCRGYGARRDEEGPMTVEAAAEDAIAVANHLGWERFHVVGHSMGGMVAQRLMVDVPGRLLSAILIAPVPASGAKIDDDRRALLVRAAHEADIRRGLIDINTGKTRNDAFLDHVLAISLSSTTAKGLEAYMTSWTTTDFADKARGNLVPVLTIIGELDPGAQPQRIKDTILAWYPNARLEQMKGVGHYPMQEDPVALVSMMYEHLKTAQPREIGIIG
ncbi:alpha/beta fold hydrolase [Mesorhizobium sp. AaZ16]|uniref:alpha/beta fold hydrolase n=1 Tax=Mesorhizobium sp. AaZ16 TaxID=3402289 RepID=UPI00374FA4AF